MYSRGWGRIISKIFLIINKGIKYPRQNVFPDMGFGERISMQGWRWLFGAWAERGLLCGEGVLQLLGWDDREGVCSQADGDGYAG
jgi:hypothetical protein